MLQTRAPSHFNVRAVCPCPFLAGPKGANKVRSALPVGSDLEPSSAHRRPGPALGTGPGLRRLRVAGSRAPELIKRQAE